MQDIKIFFDEALHKYTDEYGNVFTSVTTVLGKYEEEFDTDKVARICEKIGKNPNHPKYEKYKGKTARQLKKEWQQITDIALDKGNKKHNYLEDVIKKSNGYKRVKGKFIQDRIFTIPDIVKHPTVGRVYKEDLERLGINNRYPDIFDLICTFIDNGWKLYAEIGVYNTDLLISGLVDLLLVKGNKFFIIDWKTNKSPISFQSGYYEKDNNGSITSKFIITGKTLKYPVKHLPSSTGHKYSLQLSGYAYLIEQFGLELSGIVLCHIQEKEDGEEFVDLLKIKYLKKDVQDIFFHHTSNNTTSVQSKMFI